MIVTGITANFQVAYMQFIWGIPYAHKQLTM